MKSAPYFSRRPLNRRTLLKSTGVSLALPLLEAMRPSFGWATGTATPEPPRRMLSILTNMGILPGNFFPEPTGRDWTGGGSRYLDVLEPFHAQTTVFSGVSHPEVDGGHRSDIAFLTAAPHPGTSGFRNTISLDQFVAERIGSETRLSSLSLLVGVEGKRSLSWTGSGVMIPSERHASAVFQKLFVQGTPQETAVQLARLKEGRSILDLVAGRAKRLETQLSLSDQEKMDQYFTSVREAEKRLHEAEAWETRPKPTVEAAPPKDIADPADLIGKSGLMYDMARLALQTDSTRTVSIFIEQDHNPTVKLPNGGITQGHHSLTHHGNKPDTLSELGRIEEAQFGTLAELLGGLRDFQEDGRSLLDQTMVLYGTNLGNANAHSNNNLPVLLAGGGFEHGQHLALGGKYDYPLPNLFVSMMQQMGVEADRFATSTGTMRGLG